MRILQQDGRQANALPESAALAKLEASGLFELEWFLERNRDLTEPGLDPLRHYHLFGWREGRWPNAYFDPARYLNANPDVLASGIDPLLHYALYGEREGRQPIGYFDPV